MMNALDSLGLREVIKEQIARDVPFLGICLGLQALFETSAESPEASGLGIFPGRVERFPAELRVPHMGWNTIEPRKPSRLFGDAPNERHVYFAHSFFAPLSDATALACRYSRVFSAAVERGNCFGVQFHPEKSGAAGLELVRRFAAL